MPHIMSIFMAADYIGNRVPISLGNIQEMVQLLFGSDSLASKLRPEQSEPSRGQGVGGGKGYQIVYVVSS
jgi:hypothetical protein